MNNSYFGKFIENQRQRLNFKLVNEVQQFDRSVAKSSFKRSVVFNENLIGIHFSKGIVKLNKPIFIGISILELARHFMYKSYYEDIPDVFFDCARPELLYMDTDSFVLSINTNDVEKYMNHSIFDCSNYPIDHPCFDISKKQVPGYFKNELGGLHCSKYISLQPKVYSLEILDNYFNKITMKKAKGVKRNVLKNEITFSDYFECLFENKTITKDQILFKSYRHEIYTIKQKKLCLNSRDGPIPAF